MGSRCYRNKVYIALSFGSVIGLWAAGAALWIAGLPELGERLVLLAIAVNTLFLFLDDIVLARGGGDGQDKRG